MYQKNILLKGEVFDNNTIVPGFNKAEEKAVKAIQKHSMNINGTQRIGKRSQINGYKKKIKSLR